MVDGVAIHWYADAYDSPTFLTQVHEKYPDKFLLYSEVNIFFILFFNFGATKQ